MIVPTWYLVSKLSWVNLRMIDVFPTFWSPKNTILYFICIVVPASLYTPASVITNYLNYLN